VHTVVASRRRRTTQVRVSPASSRRVDQGQRVRRRGYYIRVRKSAVWASSRARSSSSPGNTGVDKLDFTANADPTLSKELPAAFAIGDEIEVHSGQYVQPALTWVNQDPADIWWELLHGASRHPERPHRPLGHRHDRPQRTAAQGHRPRARRRRDAGEVQGLADHARAETADKLIDQLSFIMGGTTVEIAGQIVFRQIYPLRDAAGRITVAPDPPTVTFDPRDYFGLETPTGREQRISEMACDYGVDTHGRGCAADVHRGLRRRRRARRARDAGRRRAGHGRRPDRDRRWCFNSADGGFFLATQLASQVVLATSTGRAPLAVERDRAAPGADGGRHGRRRHRSVHRLGSGAQRSRSAG
jgi:hypothetical protein